MNDMENLRTFADQLWKYIVPKIDSKFASNVSYFRAQVVSNLGNNKLEVQRPLENRTLTLPCVRAMSGAQAGQQVVALVMGSMSNAIVVGDGNLNVPGGGGGAGIANFQAQPDGSLVITLTNGVTFTATPIMDDVPTRGSNLAVKSGGIYTALNGKADNAFSNVQVGSTTISADNNADTLTLNAGGLVTLTGNATNDSVTIYVDPNHTHITTQVLDLVNADSYGPSGLVTFDADVAEVPLKNCIVDIEPAQAGSGDPSPSNVRSISGWTGAQIHVSPTTAAEDGTTYVVDWSADAGTVYRGTLDVLTGLLTVTHAGRRFSSLTWTKNASANTFNGEGFVNRLATIDGSGEAGCFCDAYKWYKSTDPGLLTNHGIALAKTGSLSTRIYVTDLRFTAVDGFTASFGSYDPLVVCPLATPVTYQLTPQAVTTLAGANNIWADTGNITVEYGAFLPALDKAIEEHSDDDIRHITEAERTEWNKSLDYIALLTAKVEMLEREIEKLKGR